MNNQMPYGFNPNMNYDQNNTYEHQYMPMFPGTNKMDYMGPHDQKFMIEERVQDLENRVTKIEKKLMINNDIDYQSSMHMM